jgi:hypothetical protein
MPRLSLRWLPVWLATLRGLWRLRSLLPILGSLPLVLRSALAHFIGDSRERIEVDVIAGPTRSLEGRAFAAATSTGCARPQSVA